MITALSLSFATFAQVSSYGLPDKCFRMFFVSIEAERENPDLRKRRKKSYIQMDLDELKADGIDPKECGFKGDLMNAVAEENYGSINCENCSNYNSPGHLQKVGIVGSVNTRRKIRKGSPESRKYAASVLIYPTACLREKKKNPKLICEPGSGSLVNSDKSLVGPAHAFFDENCLAKNRNFINPKTREKYKNWYEGYDIYVRQEKPRGILIELGKKYFKEGQCFKDADDLISAKLKKRATQNGKKIKPFRLKELTPKLYSKLKDLNVSKIMVGSGYNVKKKLVDGRVVWVPSDKKKVKLNNWFIDDRGSFLGDLEELNSGTLYGHDFDFNGFGSGASNLFEDEGDLVMFGIHVGGQYELLSDLSSRDYDFNFAAGITKQLIKDIDSFSK